MTNRRRSALAVAAWTAFLVAAVAALHALGHGPLAAPPAGDLEGWLQQRDAPTAAFALLRLGLLPVGWYLLASTVLAIVLRVARADSTATAVEACTPAPVRRLLRAAAGVSIAASILAVSAAAASDADAPVTMRRLPDVPAEREPVVMMTRLPDGDEGAGAAPTVVVVAPGDSFWRVAERALGAAWMRPPTDREIDPYWRRLVDDNRAVLPIADEPDFLVPGLSLTLPPLPPNPRP
jgi:nucleoid-associated protein YgaU